MNNNYIETYKFQAALISSAELEIKKVLKSCILVKAQWDKVVEPRIKKIIDRVIDNLTTTELEIKIANSLLRFAYIEYYKLFQQLSRLTLDTAIILGLAVLSGVKRIKASDRQTVAKAIEKLPIIEAQGITPNNAFIEVTTGYYEVAQPLMIYSRMYNAQVENAFVSLAESNAKEDYSTNVSLRNVAEMIVRQNYHIQQLSDIKSTGINLVWISTHGNCSKRCQPWQGRLYSLNGTSGEIDGNHYIPLEVATDQYETTKSGKVYKNGIISGFNCRHSLVPYTNKYAKPPHVSADVIAREREINNQQRYMERTTRKYEDLAVAFKGVNPNKSRHYAQLANEWQNKYIGYSIDNKVAYYPSRLDLFSEDDLQSQYKSDIILNEESTNDIRRECLVDWNSFNANSNDNVKSVKDLLVETVGNDSVGKSIEKGAREILKQRDKTEYETLMVFDSNSGKLIGRSDSNLKSQSKLTNKLVDMLKSGDRDSYIMLHNHPRSTPPSIQDLMVSANTPSVKTNIIVGHDGNMYSYKVNSEINMAEVEKLYNSNLSKFNDTTIALNATHKQLKEEGDIHYEKRFK